MNVSSVTFVEEYRRMHAGMMVRSNIVLVLHSSVVIPSFHFLVLLFAAIPES